MKFILLLALRNLSRYKRRTLITASAIAFGLMLFFIFDSLIIGMQSDSERNLRDYETSHIRILHQDYWQDRLMRPLDESISDPEELIRALKENGYRATRRIMFLADMILGASDFGEDGNLAVEVTGFDTETDFTVFEFSRTLEKGRFPSEGADEVAIGSWFAEDIGAEAGDYITLVTRGNGGFYEVMDLEITGIVNCPNPNVNRGLLLVPLSTVDDYLAMDGAVTEIDIALPPFADAETERAKIENLAGEYQVMTWRELAADYFAFAAADEGAADLMLFFVFIITAVGISNTMLMSVQERTRELGMMRSLGMKERDIIFLFFLEAGWIGLLGSLAGLLLGALINIFLVEYGIDFSFMMRDMDMGYRVQGLMKGVWAISTFLKTLATGTLLPMIFALIPTRRSLKTSIPDCLHHQ